MTESAPLPSLLDWACLCMTLVVVSASWSYAAWRRDEAQHRRDAQVLADAIEAHRREETRRTRQ